MMKSMMLLNAAVISFVLLAPAESLAQRGTGGWGPGQMYYGYTDDSRGWLKMMRGAIGTNAAYFNSHRMMRRYATEAYLR